MPFALIVSADATTAARLAEDVRVGGWDVILATDGAAALRIAQQRHPHVLILSGQVPGGGARSWPRGTAESSSRAIRAATQLLRREAERLLPAEADLLVRVIGEQTRQLGHMAGNA